MNPRDDAKLTNQQVKTKETRQDLHESRRAIRQSRSMLVIIIIWMEMDRAELSRAVGGGGAVGGGVEVEL